MNSRTAHIIQLPLIQDARGKLSLVEAGEHIPFDIKRVYYLYALAPGATRGGHAHQNLEQLLIPIAGSFDVCLHDGFSEMRMHLCRPDQGLYLPGRVWRHIENFSEGAVCLVLASAAFSEEDYIRDFDQFLKLRQ